MIILLHLDMNKAVVMANKLLFRQNCVVLPLFADCNPFYPHVAIKESIQMKVILLLEAQHLESKHTASPSLYLIELPPSAKKTKKKKQPLKRLLFLLLPPHPLLLSLPLTFPQ